MALPANEFGASFFLGVAGVLSAALALLIKGCCKSKCSEVDFCGVHIERAVEIELKEDMATCVAATPESRKNSSENSDRLGSARTARNAEISGT